MHWSLLPVSDGIASDRYCQFACIARIGQKRMHFLHWMHFSGSISGRPYPFCFIAFAGQTLTAGHAWFCGHLCLSTVIFMFQIPFYGVNIFMEYVYYIPYGGICKVETLTKR